MPITDLDPALRSVQATYDQVAVDYTDLLRDHLATSWTDQAMLKLFADLVLHPDEGTMADASVRSPTSVAVRGGSPGTWPRWGSTCSASTCHRA